MVYSSATRECKTVYHCALTESDFPVVKTPRHLWFRLAGGGAGDERAVASFIRHARLKLREFDLFCR